MFLSTVCIPDLICGYLDQYFDHLSCRHINEILCRVELDKRRRLGSEVHIDDHVLPTDEDEARTLAGTYLNDMSCKLWRFICNVY